MNSPPDTKSITLDHLEEFWRSWWTKTTTSTVTSSKPKHLQMMSYGGVVQLDAER